MQYWLIKSEATCYSIDDLQRDKKTSWTGVRNYQARNFMRDMTLGDFVLFYHSSPPAGEEPAVVGVAKVVAAAHPDITAQDKKDEHFDPKATKENPVWMCTDVGFVEKFKRPVTLSEIKFRPEFAGMMVAQRGSRLSVQPVSEKQFKKIKEIAEKER